MYSTPELVRKMNPNVPWENPGGIHPSWTIDGKRLCLTHVPKTGGLAIRQAFGLGRLGHQPIIRKRDWLFTFALVRNPWDRIVSAYHFIRSGGVGRHDPELCRRHLDDGKLSFGDFVRLLESAPVDIMATMIHARPMSFYLCDQAGNVLADYVGRFENLQQTCDYICGRVGVPKVDIPVLNASKHKPYQEYYDSDLIDIVGHIYEQDVRTFKYTFDNSETGEKNSDNGNTNDGWIDLT